jgi:hypothetical protein
MARIYLGMALFWLLLGGIMVSWPRWHGGDSPFLLVGTDLSFGWAALVLGLYNLLRWWSGRSLALQRRAEAEALRQRARRHPTAEPPPAEPDPAFDFTDPPRPPLA